MARREMTYYDSRDRRRRGSRRSRGRRHESYGSDGFGGRRAAGRRGFSIFDWLMTIVSIVVATGFALSWMARWIPPASYGFMSAAGLFAPVLYALNFLCLLYWVIRWRRGVLIPLAVLVSGSCGVTLFFRPHLIQSHSDPSLDRSLVDVMTYNVRGMMRPAEGSSALRSSMTDVVAVVDSMRPDIVCIQEFASTPDYPASNFEESLPVYNYSRKRYNIAGSEQNHGWGNAIYSKFPITGSGHIDFGGTNNSILWADVAVGRDTVRVFNAHLQTTAIKASDERYIVDMDFVGDQTRSSRMKGIVGRLTQNYIIRAVQADTLAARIASSPHPVVVCGDFNDTPVSWAYRRVARHLRDSFREAGLGYGHTYRGFFDMLRIDYMLHSPTMECVWYASPEFDNSDHNPVAVKFLIR